MSNDAKKTADRRRASFEYVGSEHETLVQGTFYTYWCLTEHTGMGINTIRSRMGEDQRHNKRKVKVITDYALRPLQTKPFEWFCPPQKKKELSELTPRCENECEVMSAAWLKKPLRSRA